MRSNFLTRVISKPSTGSAQLGRERSTGIAPDSWGNLMVAAQSGHGGAYRRLLGEVTEWLTRYFQRRLPPGDVDDAVQETLLAIHRRRHTYDPRYPFGPWLAAVAKNKWVDQLRSLARRPVDELSDEIAIDGHETAVVSSSVLASLLEQLRPVQAQAILLVKVHGFSVEDASRQSGLSPSAVKMNIHRGMARLTSIIEKTPDVE
jgi:RNA polymerase sigma factor (sigma-70 family)